MKVKTTITFEVEYSLEMDFFGTDDDEKALGIERACVIEDPVVMIDSFAARNRGTFTTKVERI